MHGSRNFTHHLGRALVRCLSIALMTTSLGAPAAQSTLSFVVLGDWGKGNVGQRAVARERGHTAAVSDARFVVSVGDNFYPRGVSGVDDPHWRDEFEGVYVLARFSGRQIRIAPSPWSSAQIVYSQTARAGIFRHRTTNMSVSTRRPPPISSTSTRRRWSGRCVGRTLPGVGE